MISNMIYEITLDIIMSCPIRHVQATGSKRGQEGDEANMSTEDELEVVVKKMPPTKKRCATKFRQI